MILAKEFSVPMALVDFIPVVLFGLAICLLIKCLANKMSKIQLVLFSTGGVNVFIAGFLKALYKLLYALNVCDFVALNNMFFPVQSIGFLLLGVGAIWFVFKKNKLLSVPPVFSGTFVFVGFMCGGLLLLDVAVSVIAKRLKKSWVIILFILSFICSLCMGYLSSQDFEQAFMNWVAEVVNIVGQGSLFVGVYVLSKNGLGDYNA